MYRAISQWDKKSGGGWHDDYGANARTPGEKQVFEEFLKTPEVRYCNKPYLEEHFADHIKSTHHSGPLPRNHGHIIAECRLLCLVLSPEEPTLSILAVHLLCRQHKYSMSSMQKRTKQRTKLVLHLIHPWLTRRQPMPRLYLLSFHLISVPLHLEGHPPSYHPFLNQTLALPRLLAARSLHHLPPFLQQPIPILLHDVTFLWAQRVLSPLVVMLAAASLENASTMQDL